MIVCGNKKNFNFFFLDKIVDNVMKHFHSIFKKSFPLTDNFLFLPITLNLITSFGNDFEDDIIDESARTTFNDKVCFPRLTVFSTTELYFVKQNVWTLHLHVRN